MAIAVSANRQFSAISTTTAMTRRMSETAGETIAICISPVVVSTSPVRRDRIPPVFMSHSFGSGRWSSRSNSDRGPRDAIHQEPAPKTIRTAPITRAGVASVCPTMTATRIPRPAITAPHRRAMLRTSPVYHESRSNTGCGLFTASPCGGRSSSQYRHLERAADTFRLTRSARSWPDAPGR